MKLTPEDHQRLQTRQLANIIRKLHSGKTLTAREETILAEARVSGSDSAAEVPAATTTAFARTWDELADACHVDRRTLTNARQTFGKLCPKDRADGRKEIAAWLSFLEEKGIRGRGINNPNADYVDERQLRLKREQVQLAKAEFELEKARQSMLPVAEFEAALAAMVGAFISTISQVPGRAALKIVARVKIAALDLLRGALTENQFAKVEGQLDAAAIEYGEIQQIIDAEIEHARRTLVQCEYLPAAPPAADTPPAECPSPPKPPVSSAASSAPRSRRRRAKSSGRSSKK